MKELISIANEVSNIDALKLHEIHLYLHYSHFQRPGRPFTPKMLKDILKEEAAIFYLEYIRLLKDEGVIELKISENKECVWILPSSFIVKFLNADNL